jgi:hypothetical protein
LTTTACGDRSTSVAAAAEADLDARRNAALRAARVWEAPPIPIGRANLGDNPPGDGGYPRDSEVECKFVVEPVGGTTPKFNCELRPGDVAKVKYGKGNPEVFAEVAATRLLRALGFGADDMYLVKAVKCRGCPPFPFPALKCLQETGMRTPCFAGGLDMSSSEVFKPAAIERRFHGDPIEGKETKGWAWFELERVSEAAGGSPAAHVDALRLLVVFLAHWDNKSENQRLLCRNNQRRPDGSCVKPYALVHDLGSTFGPTKLDVVNWRQTPVWADAKRCTVSMANLPFKGATFPERQISEAGRRFLLGLLEQLSQQQLVDLFTGSGITSFDHVNAAGRDARVWAAAFADKVKQIREAGPCE